jgi:hypothetical protein
MGAKEIAWLIYSLKKYIYIIENKYLNGIVKVEN